MGGLLGILVFLPLLGALLVPFLPPPWWRRVVLGSAVLAAVLSLSAARAALRPDALDLPGAWSAEGGLLDQALERAGLGPGLVAAFHDSILARDEPARRLALEEAAGVVEAEKHAHDVRRLYPGELEKQREAGEDVRAARARYAELVLQRGQLEEELLPLSRAVASQRAAELRLVSWRPWVPTLGLTWFLGVDALGAILLLVTALLGLAAALGLPPSEEARGPAAACLALQGALSGVLVAQDVALAWGFLLLLQLPGWLLLLGEDGPGRARQAERWALLALSTVLPLGAALGAAGALGGQVPKLALPALSGSVPAAVQGGLFVAIALAAIPRLLPLPGAWGAGALLGRTPGPVRPLLQLAWVGAGALLLLSFAFPLTPQALRASQLGLTALGTLALLGGGLSALREPHPGTDLVVALTQARAGLVALGVASGTEAGLLGAALALVSLALCGGAAQIAAAGLERGGGDLAQRLARRPVLARLGGVALVFLAGFPGLGVTASALVLVGAWNGLPLGATGLALGGVALLLAAAVRTILKAATELRAAAPRGVSPDVTPAEASGLVPLLLLDLLLAFYPALLLDPLTAACVRLVGGMRS